MNNDVKKIVLDEVWVTSLEVFSGEFTQRDRDRVTGTAVLAQFRGSHATSVRVRFCVRVDSDLLGDLRAALEPPAPGEAPPSFRAVLDVVAPSAPPVLAALERCFCPLATPEQRGDREFSCPEQWKREGSE